MVKVVYTITIENGYYFDNSFGNYLPAESQEVIEETMSLEDFENFKDYGYYDEILSVSVS